MNNENKREDDSRYQEAGEGGKQRVESEGHVSLEPPAIVPGTVKAGRVTNRECGAESAYLSATSSQSHSQEPLCTSTV